MFRYCPCGEEVICEDNEILTAKCHKCNRPQSEAEISLMGRCVKCEKEMVMRTEHCLVYCPKCGIDMCQICGKLEKLVSVMTISYCGHIACKRCTDRYSSGKLRKVAIDHCNRSRCIYTCLENKEMLAKREKELIRAGRKKKRNQIWRKI